ncbi:hypothetical protein IscW_ISCW001071 [Ixodes scapularis]|uniref:Uncharacterized protein n=1 Tax=Ixodes scapularis TaxID=6945 RepID=B7P7C3_IXOSC|nr:hypothetical protein IscW_ISCW001071 [Ixodes scapularis]|eukprot:XP_002410008.1 hypothetical protein IscW_ISCW001071 [Ixodes scapularis]
MMVQARPGSDTTESDGIYSAFFTDHTGPGRYQVAVRATGGNSAKTVTPPADRSSFSELGRLPPGFLDIRCSQHANQLEESFEEAIRIRKADLLRGSLSPQAPNKKHELLIKVPSKALSSRGRPSFNLFFALKTRNAEGDESPVSNIARLSYGGLLNLRSRPRLVKVQVRVSRTTANLTGSEPYR